MGFVENHRVGSFGCRSQQAVLSLDSLWLSGPDRDGQLARPLVRSTCSELLSGLTWWPKVGLQIWQQAWASLSPPRPPPIVWANGRPDRVALSREPGPGIALVQASSRPARPPA